MQTDRQLPIWRPGSCTACGWPALLRGHRSALLRGHRPALLRDHRPALLGLLTKGPRPALLRGHLPALLRGLHALPQTPGTDPFKPQALTPSKHGLNPLEGVLPPSQAKAQVKGFVVYGLGGSQVHHISLVPPHLNSMPCHGQPPPYLPSPLPPWSALPSPFTPMVGPPFPFTSLVGPPVPITPRVGPPPTTLPPWSAHPASPPGACPPCCTT